MEYFIGDSVLYEGQMGRISKIDGDKVTINCVSTILEANKEEISRVHQFEFEPFDYGSMLEAERDMLRDMYDYFSSDKAMIADAKVSAKEIKLAIKLLNIILGYDESYYQKNGRRHLTVYSNLGNASRFDVNLVGDKIFLSQFVREEKAWLLYNRLRHEKMRKWWE